MLQLSFGATTCEKTLSDEQQCEMGDPSSTGVFYAAGEPDGCEGAPEDCGFEKDFALLLATFHGATWGHMTPRNSIQQFIACLVASAGYILLEKSAFAIRLPSFRWAPGFLE